MTTTKEQQCGRDVTYNYGMGITRCGATVNGEKVLCMKCRNDSDGASGHAVREACRATLQELKQVLAHAQSAQRKHLVEAESCEAQAIRARAQIADLEAFLAAE